MPQKHLGLALDVKLNFLEKIKNITQKTCETIDECRKVKLELRVTSSNPRVTSLNPRVTSSNPRVTSSNPRVTSSNQHEL